MALQHARVQEAAARREDLPDSFPLDPDVFEYVYPRSNAPAGVRALVARINPPASGVYRGSFLPGAEHYVVVMDSDGDHWSVCVLDATLQLVACACANVDALRWMSLEELIPYARDERPHPGPWRRG